MQERSVTVREMGDRYRVRNGEEQSKGILRLRGAWLVDAGFLPGCVAQVLVERGRIVLVAGGEKEKGDG